MSRVDDLLREPFRFDVLAMLRHVEATHPAGPRIGDSSARREEYVALGEDPYLAFPASTVARAERDGESRLRLFVKFLGLLGPQGALPLAMTEESYHWTLAHDDAFPRFLDLLNNRFLQLFFRAWADARPIAQHDRPEADRFVAYIGSTIGLGSAVYAGLDTVPDDAKLALAGLLAPQARSAARLRGAVAAFLGVRVEIEEFVGRALEFEPADRSRLGRRHATLGSDCLLGASVFSVEDAFRIRIFTRDLAHYETLLPSGQACEPLADLVFFYLGDELDWDLELALPERAVEPVRLGQSGRLGYTTWMVGHEDRSARTGYRRDARFQPAERLARRRRERARA